MRRETFDALMKRQLEIYDIAVGRARQEVKTERLGPSASSLGEEVLDVVEDLGHLGLRLVSAYGGHKIVGDAPEGKKSMVEKLCELKSLVKRSGGEDSLMTKMVYRVLGLDDLAAIKAANKMRDDAAVALEKAEPVFTKIEQYGKMLEKYADNKKIGVTEAVGNPTAELYAALNTFETEEEHEKFLKDYEDVLKYAAVEVVLHDGSEVVLRFDKDHFYALLTIAKAKGLEDFLGGGDGKVRRRAEELDSIYQEALKARELLGPVEELVTKTIDYAMQEHKNALQLRREYPRESRIKLKELYA